MKKLAMLASDADMGRIRFPCLAQPKIDGVRAINFTGTLTGRSLEPHANAGITEFFSAPDFLHMDGEMASGRPNDPDLCRRTTSNINRHAGPLGGKWFLFDYARDMEAPYVERLAALFDHVSRALRPEQRQVIGVVPSIQCRSLDHLLAVDDYFVCQGFEGTIVRDPWGLYKHGRSTVKEGGLLRVKRFIEAEAIVTKIYEGEANNNEAQRDARGLVKRSTHQANMAKNGMVGSMLCIAVSDVHHLGSVLFKKDQLFMVSAGRMTRAERVHFWNNQNQLLAKVIKFKTFPTGVKDKPRFPTFQTLRMKSDL